MTPLGAAAVLAVVVCLGALCLAVWYVPAYHRFLGKRIVTCPETSSSAVVEVNVVKYTATSLYDRPVLKLASCTRWPGRSNCRQECLPQVTSEKGAVLPFRGAHAAR